jgi:CubicO group peptidase (beta-lactamase class C family)
MTPFLPATLVTAALLAAPACSPAQTERMNPVSASAPSRDQAVDALMAPYARPDGPGASAVVIRDGRVAYVKSYGLARVEKHEPVTAESNFRLASLSKQFTATAIMLLAAEGKVRYDDSLATLLPLPELPAYALGVTVRQLLNHTSGLPEYEDFVPDSQTAQVHDRDIPRLIAGASSPRFAAGTKYEYSNTGYVLLALIVERVSGIRFADFLHERIFVPLGMTGTVALEEGRSMVPHRAYGYTVDSTAVRFTDQSNTSATLGDGGIYSSATDLTKWDRALEQHSLVSAEAQRLAWTPPALPGGQKTEYGFGWFVDQDRGTMRLKHHGESRGFTNAILRYPERRLTVVILTNRNGGAPWDIAQRIADLYLPER